MTEYDYTFRKADDGSLFLEFSRGYFIFWGILLALASLGALGAALYFLHTNNTIWPYAIGVFIGGLVLAPVFLFGRATVCIEDCRLHRYTRLFGLKLLGIQSHLLEIEELRILDNNIVEVVTSDSSWNIEGFRNELESNIFIEEVQKRIKEFLQVYKPCFLDMQPDGLLTLSYDDFDDFIDYLEDKGGQGGGYSWEALVKAVIRLRDIKVEDVEFDPESDRFWAVSSNSDSLLKIVNIIKELGENPELMESAITDSEAHDEFE